MSYTIRFRPAAGRALRKLEREWQRRIAEGVEAIRHDPLGAKAKKMKPRSPPRWRVRVGDYRIVYAVHEDAGEIEIVAIGHRRDVYRS